MYILFDLEVLEYFYFEKDGFVIFGVYFVKFENEKFFMNILSVILWYDIRYVVVNDFEIKLWYMLLV